MALDLSGLMVDTPANAFAANAETGKPMEIALALIDEDPEQPRASFDVDALRELAESIAQSGVKSPISVRRSLLNADRWVLNYGARRLRASQAAGKTTIPAFIDEAHNSYDQVIENLQRDDLKPMELALFIQKRLALGEKKGTIAKFLGKKSEFITQHMALLDMPESIERIYNAGNIRGAKAIYDLRALRKKYEDKVDAWLDEQPEHITQQDINALRKRIENLRQEEETLSQETAYNRSPSSLFNRLSETEEADTKPERSPIFSKIATHNPDNEKPQTTRPEDPDKIKKPLLLVLHKKNPAMLLLNRRPSIAGFAFIRYEDGSGEVEVDLTTLTLNLLTESKA